MNSSIAIIIPAYKKDFLRSTLESIAAQDCRDFTVYVGDDASPADIYGIVHSFEDRIDIVYHRFEYNLGRTDLVGHWKRCIDMSDEQAIAMSFWYGCCTDHVELGEMVEEMVMPTG